MNDTAPIIQVGNSTGVDGALYLGNNNHGVKRAFNGTPGTNDVGFYTLNGGIALSTNGEGTIGEFYMNDSGNIGIGTSNPQNLLHVTGDVSLETGLTVGFVGTPSTDTLYVGDPNFHLAYSSGINPYPAFDTFGFIRASDTFSWAANDTILVNAWHNMGVSNDLIGDPFRTFYSGHLVTPTN